MYAAFGGNTPPKGYIKMQDNTVKIYFGHDKFYLSSPTHFLQLKGKNLVLSALILLTEKQKSMPITIAASQKSLS